MKINIFKKITAAFFAVLSFLTAFSLPVSAAEVPLTGDENNNIVWFIVGGVALFLLVLLIILNKKSKNDDE